LPTENTLLVPGETPGKGAPGTKGIQQSVSPSLDEPAKRQPLTLKDCEDLALANNPTLKQATELVRRSAAQARQAGLYTNPSLGYDGSEIRGGSYGGGEEGAFVQQTIILGGKLRLRRRVFQAQLREDETGIRLQRDRLMSDVGQRFYAALAAQELVTLRGQLLSIAQDAMQTAHQLANVGQADLADVLQAEVEAEQAGVDCTSARSNYIRAFKALAATVGRPELALSPLQGDLTDWPQIAPAMIDAIVRDSPAVKRAEDAVARAEAQIQSARREAIPDLQLRAGVQQDDEALNEAASKLKPVGVIGLASVGVNIPIFNRNQGNVAAAQIELNAAREEVTRVQLSLRRTAERLFRAYLEDENEATQYRADMIPKAAHAYQLYLKDYRQMAAAYPEVLISQRTLFELQIGYVKAVDKLWQNAIALQNFALTNGLAPPSASGSTSTTVNLPNGGAGSPAGE
jgi:outer membrane protein, heavy metal efflux system